MTTAAPRSRRSTQGRDGRDLRWALKTIAAAFFAMALLFTVADHALPKEPGLTVDAIESYHGDTVLGGRARWDSRLFRSIADDGYRYPTDSRQNPAFSPAYPLAMRFGGYAVGDPTLAGVLIGIACGALGLVLFYRWCSLRLPAPTARIALLTLLVYPYAVYLYGVSYSDAVLFAAALSAFFLLDKGHRFLPALIAAVASATRLPGLALSVGLILRTIELRGVYAGPGADTTSSASLAERVRRLRANDLWLLLGFSGFVAYCAYLWRTFNSPFLFMEASKGWANGSGLSTLIKAGTVDMLRDGPNSLRFGLIFQMALYVLAIALTPSVFRRFGWAYGAYTSLILLSVLVGRSDFYGSGRYVLAAFPIFASAAVVLASRPAWRPRLAVLSGSLLAVVTTMWITGSWIS
jgi:hypothetical protein